MRRLAFLLLVPALGCGRPAAAPVADDAPPPDEVIGRVLAGDSPVEGARVRLKATAHAATTDAHGRFRLPRPDGAGRVTAWKDGFLIAGAGLDADPLDLRLTPLPAADHDGYQWVDPAPKDGAAQNCANCHADIYKEWAASGHARSASGRRFRNLYEGTNWDGDSGVGWGLLNEHPVGAGVCAACHAPALPDDDSAQFDLRELRGVAARGVHCDYCHKVSAVGDGKLGLTFGRYNLRLLRPGEGQLFFGPLDDVDRGEDAYSPLYHESRYCASCHEGVVFGVPVYTTYSEWLDSPARRDGKQCQDCHMAPTGKMTNVAPSRGGVERDPKTLANHRFFDGGQDEMLRKCLNAEAGWQSGDDETRLTVRLRADGAGHRVPTGFIDRHLILTVAGEDAAGRPLAVRSGPTLPAAAGKDLAGKPGKLYAKLLKDFDGHSPAPFWRADPDADDTRLEPGRADEAEFAFPPGLARAHVRVIYRRFWDEVVRAKGWPDRDLTVLDRAFTPPAP
jgi:hypothetical protein